MVELNMALRQHALNGLQTQLDAAVTNGDTEQARKIAGDIAQLELSTAPKAAAYGDVDIKAELDKQSWFGVDPEKTAAAMTFGKTMDPKKFPTAAAFAEAIIKAVDTKFKPAAPAPKAEDEEPGEEEEPAPLPKKRKTDGPGEGEGGVRGAAGVRRGPWTKMSDAPAAVQADVKRQADKYVSKGAAKEVREKFISDALAVHYRSHQASKGK